MAKNRNAEREADRKALDGIIEETVEWALQLRADGGCISDPIELSMNAGGESLANRLGHGFDRDVIDAWEEKCRAAYRKAVGGV